ncbi:hypothetical protein [Marinobacterium rhizophilum]|uniref:TetR family transcriptional regulator n=1 Tax=Marinobacterium rhizophilum TaxID=420402 RepID=A0ABY5HN58_9GAMM|nr:hypothetical protein [Marinobacterium rhizophilum]UTW13845.1 hypothetical protein KDW95_09505 [Marinobacterium rhizophilum]
MNSTQQTETIETQFDINNFDLQEIMNRAHTERSKVFYAFFKSLSFSRRQVVPVWEQTFKQLFARFSH